MNARLIDRLTPRRLLAASVAVAVVTIGLKTLAWTLTGSVGLLSDAMESFVNLAGATFGLLMVTVAARPADEDHPYGHHKAEYFSAGFEGVLIVAAALGIVWAAVGRWRAPQPLVQLDWGLALSVLSSVLNAGLAWVMLQAARAHRSVALEGDARHLFTDVWTSVGVVAGLLLVWLTDWLWLDPLLALLVALNIVREGGRLVWRSAQGLMDVAVAPDVQQAIGVALQACAQAGGWGAAVRFDHVHTRQAGHRCFVDLHMHLPADWTLQRAALARDEVECALMAAVPGLCATIQLLPHGVEAHCHHGEGQA